MTFLEKYSIVIVPLKPIKMSSIHSHIINGFIASCDANIKAFQEKIDNRSEWSDIFLKLDYKSSMIDIYQISIKILQVQKLMYLTIKKKKGSREIFSKLFSKYDNYLAETYDLSNNMVLTGEQPEGHHLIYCSTTLDNRNYLKDMCDYFEENSE